MPDRTNDRRRVTAFATCVACVAAIALASPAWAQSPGGGSPGGTRGGADPGTSGPRPDAMRGLPAADAPLNPGAMVQKQLDRLEDDLMPTAAQYAAWGAFADSVQKLADDVERVRFEARTSAGGPLSTPERLDWIASGVKARAALIQRIAEQGKALYALLSPEQKRIADSRLWLPVSLLATGLAPSAGATDGAVRGGPERARP